MDRHAALSPIIALLVGVGWMIVKALLDRRADADSWDELERPKAPPPHVPDRNQGTSPPKIPNPSPYATPPVNRRPAAPKPAPASTRPPIPSRPVGPKIPDLAHLQQSAEMYSRAAHLDKTVATRLAAIDHETSTHKPDAPKQRVRPPAAAHLLRSFRHPVTVRQAFLASFVLNPPKALE